MVRNRSVPTDLVLPHVVYRDVAAAVEWLGRVYGFREHYRYGDPTAPSGAQVYLGSAYVMVSREQDRSASPARVGHRTQSLTVFLEDVDGHYARSKAAGAKIVEEPHETVYGERQYATEDLDGHLWLFSRHAADLDPAQWGATVVNAAP
jgi:uncharacterized glyoxalase superfamily protein PhnB